MITDQVTLVKSSFASIVPAADAVATQFYARLFALDPALRVLFESDMREQRHKLMRMLAAIVDELEQRELRRAGRTLCGGGAGTALGTGPAAGRGLDGGGGGGVACSLHLAGCNDAGGKHS